MSSSGVSFRTSKLPKISKTIVYHQLAKKTEKKKRYDVRKSCAFRHTSSSIMGHLQTSLYRLWCFGVQRGMLDQCSYSSLVSIMVRQIGVIAIQVWVDSTGRGSSFLCVYRVDSVIKLVQLTCDSSANMVQWTSNISAVRFLITLELEKLIYIYICLCV